MRAGSPFSWDGHGWTFAAVLRVWPSSREVLPAKTLLALPQAHQRRVLDLFHRSEKWAYECVRAARWITETGTLSVTCLRCGRRAWSYGAVTRWNRDQQRFLPVTGKWRWRCLTDKAYLANMKRKGRRLVPAVRRGCGAQFCDTSGTPLAHSPLPAGIVLAATYYSTDTVTDLLLGSGHKAEAHALRALMGQLQKDRDLYTRLQGYGRLFCTRLLLEHCPGLTSQFHGKELVIRNWEREARRRETLAKIRQEAVTRLRERYRQMKTILGQLERLDRSHLVPSGHEDLRHRESLVKRFQALISSVPDDVLGPIRTRGGERACVTRRRRDCTG